MKARDYQKEIAELRSTINKLIIERNFYRSQCEQLTKVGTQLDIEKYKPINTQFILELEVQ